MDYIDEIVRASATRDGAAFQDAVDGLLRATRKCDDPAEMNAVLPRLGELMSDLPPSPASALAQVCGAMVHSGADAGMFAGPVSDGLADVLELAVSFVEMWRTIHGADAEVPEPDGTAFDSLMSGLVGAEVEEGVAFTGVTNWLSVPIWEWAALSCLQRKAGRAAFGRRTEIGPAIERLSDAYDLHWVAGLMGVLDDETLIVLHRRTGFGYQVRISGIGDNFQLHTLLAATLSGPASDGLLEGVRPEPSWIAAATDGDLEPPDGPIRGQFNLVDAYGKWIWNEGVPADIPELDGRRVVVLDPPPYQRSWHIGRAYPLMVPEIGLDRVLPADEAAGWLAKVAGSATPD